jgi:tRNA pseudouridine55 synthase
MMVEGLLLVNKPQGMTSHDVVQVVRRKLGIRRVGHTGTLDPMARGLLIVLVGAATKHQHAFQAHPKMYEAVITLGSRTDTGDATGQTMETAPVPALERAQVGEVLASFQGCFSHTPPAYSAVKVKGHPAYWWARRQQPVTLAPRTVQLFEVTLLELGAQTIGVRVRCSAGTYLRTIAELIAQRLGTVGHLSALVRLRVGEWSVDGAQTLEWVVQSSPAELAGRLLPVRGEPR